MIDLASSARSTAVIEAHVEKLDNRRIAGWQKCKTGFTVFFHAEFSKPFSSFGTWKDGAIHLGSSTQSGHPIGAFVDYTTSDQEVVLAKVGISLVDADTARKNLAEEIDGWDFDQVRKQTKDDWNEILKRIDVEGGTESERVNFYTSFYRGRDVFVKKLDEFFRIPYNHQEPFRDVTGMIGQYCHGNETDRQVPYYYNYAGGPWKSQQIIRKIMRVFHKPVPSGLCGMDDNGYLTGWYVFSALGFYPVEPSRGFYVIGSPVFSKATVRVRGADGGHGEFVIEAHNASEENIYIQSAALNGKTFRFPIHMVKERFVKKNLSDNFSSRDQSVATEFSSQPCVSKQAN